MHAKKGNKVTQFSPHLFRQRRIQKKRLHLTRGWGGRRTRPVVGLGGAGKPKQHAEKGFGRAFNVGQGTTPCPPAAAASSDFFKLSDLDSPGVGHEGVWVHQTPPTSRGTPKDLLPSPAAGVWHLCPFVRAKGQKILSEPKIEPKKCVPRTLLWKGCSLGGPGAEGLLPFPGLKKIPGCIAQCRYSCTSPAGGGGIGWGGPGMWWRRVGGLLLLSVGPEPRPTCLLILHSLQGCVQGNN